MLPSVIIEIQNGNLGFTPSTEDGVAGMVIIPSVNYGLLSDVVSQIFSLKEAEDLGITEANDTTYLSHVWRHIKDFYGETGNGAELWVSIRNSSVTLAEVCSSLNEQTNNMISTAKGKIKILGVARMHGVASTDFVTAAGSAQTLAAELASKMKPVRIILPGDNWDGSAASLTDLKTLTHNRIAITIAGLESGDKNAAIGLTLGRLAGIPVQRNIGRVKDGAIIDGNAFLTNGASVDAHEDHIEAIHDKGYLVLRQHVNKGGYYFADDPTATSDTDDFKTISNGRVIDKAYILTYNTYVEDLNDEVIINSDGSLDASYVKDMQAKIERTINQNMTAKKEISGVDCFIDHTQNIISTEELGIILDITPVGYSKKLRIKLSLKNPNIQ